MAASADHKQPVAPRSSFCCPRCCTTQEEYQSGRLDDGSTRTARRLVQRSVFALTWGGRERVLGSFGLPLQNNTEYQSGRLDDGSTRTARCLVQRSVFALTWGGRERVLGSFGLPLRNNTNGRCCKFGLVITDQEARSGGSHHA